MAPNWVIILIVVIAAIIFGLLFVATFRTPSDFEEKEKEKDGKH